jgi:ribosomal protein L35AE/L33A
MAQPTPQYMVTELVKVLGPKEARQFVGERYQYALDSTRPGSREFAFWGEVLTIMTKRGARR